MVPVALDGAAGPRDRLDPRRPRGHHRRGGRQHPDQAEQRASAITTAQIGDAAGIYIAGACVGALVFGYLTDRFGRKRLFLVTLGLYLVATVLTAFSRDAWMFFAFRFFTGMGIGGEYSAINSAIDELIPARVRGTVDLLVNGSYWLGTAVGAAATLVLLDPNLFAVNIGWRLCFLIGGVLGVAILLVRRTLPESPRWLLTHGRPDEAEATVDDIEAQVRRSTDAAPRRARGLGEDPAAGNHRIHRGRAGPSSAPTRGGRSSASRSSWARPSSTTPSSSPTHWS